MNDKILHKYIRPLLEMVGYYKFKAAIKMHFYLQRLKKEDAEKRRKLDSAIEHLPNDLLRKENEIVVSLTSYGQRIINTLPYTLYSLLTQEVLPGRIVVYFSMEEVNYNTLPAILKKIQKCGVEFYFVKDTRSYKKLIPALRMFPNNPILTVDDDMYYDRKLIGSYLDTYRSMTDRRIVFGTIGRMVTRDDSGKLMRYSEWEGITDNNRNTKTISFYGCGGCLYPPNVFDEEVLKEDLFMSMAPTADDLWFWIQEQRCGISTMLLENYNTLRNIPIDRTTWFELKRKDCLSSINDGEGKNDEQLKMLLEYYDLE